MDVKSVLRFLVCNPAWTIKIFVVVKFEIPFLAAIALPAWKCYIIFLTVLRQDETTWVPSQVEARWGQSKMSHLRQAARLAKKARWAKTSFRMRQTESTNLESQSGTLSAHPTMNCSSHTMALVLNFTLLHTEQHAPSCNPLSHTS